MCVFNEFEMCDDAVEVRHYEQLFSHSSFTMIAPLTLLGLRLVLSELATHSNFIHDVVHLVSWMQWKMTHPL